MSIFSDRVEAGRRLAEALREYEGREVVVLAIPRGGVVVGYQVARRLGAPLDVIAPRKIGAPHNPELAIGAVAEDGTIILDEGLVRSLGVPGSYIGEESGRQREEIRRRLRLYRGEAPYPDLKGRVVILVDDGVATGSTAKAALASIRRRGPEEVVVAVPVAPPSTARELEGEADRVVCLYTPEPFYAIGQFYRDFFQTSDEEVVRLLELNREEVRRA